MTKAALRTYIKDRITTLSMLERQRQSQCVSEQLISYIREHQVKTVLLYAAIDDEINIDRVMVWCWEHDIHVLLPKVFGAMDHVIEEVKPWATLYPNKYGIRECFGECPLRCRPIDLVVVPWRAYMCTWARLGRGGWFYDRCLPHIAKFQEWFVPKGQDVDLQHVLGVCFAEQIVEDIPMDDHDVFVDTVLYAN